MVINKITLFLFCLLLERNSICPAKKDGWGVGSYPLNCEKFNVSPYIPNYFRIIIDNTSLN